MEYDFTQITQSLPSLRGIKSFAKRLDDVAISLFWWENLINMEIATLKTSAIAKFSPRNDDVISFLELTISDLGDYHVTSLTLVRLSPRNDDKL